MQIRVKQINQAELSAFVSGSVQGSVASGLVENYVNSSGYLGSTIVYSSGGTQTIEGLKIFVTSPAVPYLVETGQATNRAYVDASGLQLVKNFSGWVDIFYVPKLGNATISGNKTFANPVSVATPTGDTNAIPYSLLKLVSGVLRTGLNNITIATAVEITGNQGISGTKTFFSSPLVPTPTSASGAVNRAYVDSLQILGAVYTSGNQTISGEKTFVSSPIVPVAVSPNQAVQKAQLDALGIVMGGVTGFAGVLSINGTSGASGNVYLQGAGTVTVNQCGPVFYISGNDAEQTQIFSARVPLPNGITGLSYSFGASGLRGGRPSITTSLELTGGIGGFFNHFVYGVTASGFNVAFESGIPNSNYVLNFQAIPLTTGGSGFFSIQGAQGVAGATAKPRGGWFAGTTYSFLDFIYLQDNRTSYIATATHISDSFNKPNGTGNAFWQIFSSGIMGQTGDWVYQGPYSAGTIFRRGYSTTWDDSSYAYTGLIPISGISPDTTSSGWVLIARKGALGYYINSGIVTGNFVNMSYFFEPVGTGLNLAESFVAKDFYFTGFALGCVQSGSRPFFGGILTGNIYQRTPQNSKILLISGFRFDTGQHFAFSGDFSHYITGLNRVGVEITNTISGIEKLSIGMFGFGV